MAIIDEHICKNCNKSNSQSGTTASLGVLMANVFQRSTGRAWKLRQRSQNLWPIWIKKLTTKEFPIRLENPLIKIATNEKEDLTIKTLIQTRQQLGIRHLNTEEKYFYEQLWPQNKYRGMVSMNDGRIDPIGLQQALKYNLKKININMFAAKVTSIRRQVTGKVNHWSLKLDNIGELSFEKVVICASLGSSGLIIDLGYNIPLEPVLGQAVEIKTSLSNETYLKLPPVLNIYGINIIPTQDNQIYIGATLERNTQPLPTYLEQMISLNNQAPQWIQTEEIIHQWHGLRAKPINRAAPILEQLEPGLILATAHYRNGILLTPATAEFIANEISK